MILFRIIRLSVTFFKQFTPFYNSLLISLNLQAISHKVIVNHYNNRPMLRYGLLTSSMLPSWQNYTGLYFQLHSWLLDTYEQSVFSKSEIVPKSKITCRTVVLQCYRRQAIPMD